MDKLITAAIAATAGAVAGAAASEKDVSALKQRNAALRTDLANIAQVLEDGSALRDEMSLQLEEAGRRVAALTAEKEELRVQLDEALAAGPAPVVHMRTSVICMLLRGNNVALFGPSPIANAAAAEISAGASTVQWTYVNKYTMNPLMGYMYFGTVSDDDMARLAQETQVEVAATWGAAYQPAEGETYPPEGQGTVLAVVVDGRC